MVSYISDNHTRHEACLNNTVSEANFSNPLPLESVRNLRYLQSQDGKTQETGNTSSAELVGGTGEGCRFGG